LRSFISPQKMTQNSLKSLKLITVLSLAVLALCVIIDHWSAASTNTPTTFGITTGVFTFSKNTTSGNASSTIDLGTATAALYAQTVYSSGDHQFDVSDMVGDPFTVTLQSSDLTASGNLLIPAASIGYTGTTWAGTGKVLTSAPTTASDIGTSPVTFVARTNNSGLSYRWQQITLILTVPAAQSPGSYTGTLTFTY